MHSGKAIHSEERLDFYLHALETPLPLQFFPSRRIRWERGVVVLVKKKLLAGSNLAARAQERLSFWSLGLGSKCKKIIKNEFVCNGF